MGKTKKISKDELILKIRSEKEFLIAKYFISEIGLFGSYVRGEEKPGSDVDILVEFDKYPDMFTFIEIEEYLSEMLDAKVDLVTRSALKHVIGSFIRKEVVYI